MLNIKKKKHVYKVVVKKHLLVCYHMIECMCMCMCEYLNGFIFRLWSLRSCIDRRGCIYHKLRSKLSAYVGEMDLQLLLLSSCIVYNWWHSQTRRYYDEQNVALPFSINIAVKFKLFTPFVASVVARLCTKSTFNNISSITLYRIQLIFHFLKCLFPFPQTSRCLIILHYFSFFI